LHAVSSRGAERRRLRHEEAMTEAGAIDAATKRLAAALDAREAAVDRRSKADRSESGLANQVHALGADRARLAAELDTTTAHARKLETTNREIAQRLDGAMETIRSVIATHER
jgi:hypothetical protein